MEIVLKFLQSATAILLRLHYKSTMAKIINYTSLLPFYNYGQIYCVGVITDKSVLPITRLNFGGTPISTGVHSLGKLKCTGQVAVNGMPTSCGDLWRIGHILSGLYSVMGPKMIENVYCDFTKLPNDVGKLSQLL